MLLSRIHVSLSPFLSLWKKMRKCPWVKIKKKNQTNKLEDYLIRKNENVNSQPVHKLIVLLLHVKYSKSRDQGLCQGSACRASPHPLLGEESKEGRQQPSLTGNDRHTKVKVVREEWHTRELRDTADSVACKRDSTAGCVGKQTAPLESVQKQNQKDRESRA